MVVGFTAIMAAITFDHLYRNVMQSRTSWGNLLECRRPRDAIARERAMLKRLDAINGLPQRERDALLLTVDAFLRDFSAK